MAPELVNYGNGNAAHIEAVGTIDFSGARFNNINGGSFDVGNTLRLRDIEHFMNTNNANIGGILPNKIPKSVQITFSKAGQFDNT